MDNFDLEIFKQEDELKGLQCNHKCFKQCQAMNRLFNALKYYSMLNIIENDKDAELFAHFIQNVYVELINDYIHFNNNHAHELENINKDLMNNNGNELSFAECKISSCIFAARHHSNAKPTVKNTLDNILHFYKQTMDSLHFYLFHCYDVGIRTREKGDQEQTQEKISADQYFDAEFSRINKIISKTTSITKHFDRFSKTKNAKYNIKTQKEELKKGNDGNTYLNTLYKYLQSQNVKRIHVTKLIRWIKAEEYDTDSVGYDIDIKRGNISMVIANDCVQKIQDFMKVAKLSSATFRVGLRFYYWEYYKTLKQLGMDERVVNIGININNYNEHSGYNICDLFIVPRYCSFKEEICCYKYLTIVQYHKEVLVKANEYIKANIVKRTKAVSNEGNPYVKHYGIEEDDEMKIEHLLALILYCDYSDLCSDFSSTFRKNSRYEMIGSIKKRNSKYYWLSKYLRESVEVYGQCSYTVETKERGTIVGPFYTGINVLLQISEFNIRLCSPTSTSMHMEVAIKFSTDKGMILQFDNPNCCWQYTYLRCFNVSWLSRYKEEDERLFCGGFYPTQIQSVIVRNTKQNFEEFVHSLYYLDTMLTAGEQEGIQVSNKHISMIKKLFSSFLTGNVFDKCMYDKYIYDTFAAFIQSKGQIAFDLHELYIHANSKFRDLFMNKLVQRREEIVTDSNNLFLSEMLSIFTNVNSIIIKTTDDSGRTSYSLSLTHLLSLIESGSLDNVIVKANGGGSDIKVQGDSEKDSDVDDDRNHYVEQFDNDCDDDYEDLSKPEYIERNWINALWCRNDIINKKRRTGKMYNDTSIEEWNLSIPSNTPSHIAHINKRFLQEQYSKKNYRISIKCVEGTSENNWTQEYWLLINKRYNR